MSILLGKGLLLPAFRIAGITQRPGRNILANPDYAEEAIAIINRLLGSWDIDPLDIFTYTITLYPLAGPNKISYQFGAGAADFPSAPAPIAITDANIVLAGTPLLRYPLRITDKAGWADIVLQAVPGGITTTIYPDFGFPIGTIYLYPQPPAGYQLELYTPATLPFFVALTDTVELPLGYERAIVYGMACELADTFPLQAELAPGARGTAAKALAAVERRNAKVPRMKNDAPSSRSPRQDSDWNWWRTGGFGDRR